MYTAIMLSHSSAIHYDTFTFEYVLYNFIASLVFSKFVTHSVVQKSIFYIYYFELVSQRIKIGLLVVMYICLNTNSRKQLTLKPAKSHKNFCTLNAESAQKIIKPSGKLVRVLKAQQWADTTRAHYLLYIKLIYNL